MEAAMRNISQTTQSGWVTAVYESNIRSFSLARGATLNDLAAHFAQIEEHSGRKPIAIDMKFDA
jgi:hypothetical protein